MGEGKGRRGALGRQGRRGSSLAANCSGNGFLWGVSGKEAVAPAQPTAEARELSVYATVEVASSLGAHYLEDEREGATIPAVSPSFSGRCVPGFWGSAFFSWPKRSIKR